MQNQRARRDGTRRYIRQQTPGKATAGAHGSLSMPAPRHAASRDATREPYQGDVQDVARQWCRSVSSSSCRHQVAFGCMSPPFPTFPHRSPNLRITRWAAVVYVGKPSGAGHGGTTLDSTPRGEAVRGTTYGSFRLHDFRKALYTFQAQGKLH